MPHLGGLGRGRLVALLHVHVNGKVAGAPVAAAAPALGEMFLPRAGRGHCSRLLSPKSRAAPLVHPQPPATRTPLPCCGSQVLLKGIVQHGRLAPAPRLRPQAPPLHRRSESKEQGL